MTGSGNAQADLVRLESVSPIADRRYGMRDFRIADPSGNELSIGHVLPDAEAR